MHQLTRTERLWDLYLARPSARRAQALRRLLEMPEHIANPPSAIADEHPKFEKVTAREEDRMIALYSSGTHTISAIGRIMHRGEKTIRNALIARGVHIRCSYEQKKISKRRISDVVQLYKQGVKIEELCRMMRRTPQVVELALKEGGIRDA